MLLIPKHQSGVNLLADFDYKDVFEYTQGELNLEDDNHGQTHCFQKPQVGIHKNLI